MGGLSQNINSADTGKWVGSGGIKKSVPIAKILDFFEFGKKLKFDDPPLDLIWENFEIGKILNFGNPPQRKNISLKHLKLPKNHFKTNLFLFN